jgi:serine/threonine-protein kinase
LTIFLRNQPHTVALLAVIIENELSKIVLEDSTPRVVRNIWRLVTLLNHRPAVVRCAARLAPVAACLPPQGTPWRTTVDADRNLLFGVLALQADLLTPGQFAEACSAWAGRKDSPLADLLVQHGLLTPADRADVDKLLGRKLARHGGDAKAGLAEVTTDQVRRSLAGINDPDVRQSLAPPTPPPEGPVLLATTDYLPEARDRYTLSRLHATGGIGRVWLARDASLGRDVALKELRPERAGQPALWARFLREAQVTGQLEHPGIVPVYEVGRRPDDQAPFYTMRFVRGRTFAESARDYHERRHRGAAAPLELRDLLTVFVTVCNAVAYAHSRGVLHRDLKPENVVLGEYGEVIVLDWGLAKLVGEREEGTPPLELATSGESVDGTVQGQVVGTPAYMSPEQAEGRLDVLDVRSDVYGLGAILYEVLTGQPPFTKSVAQDLLQQVVHEPPTPPHVFFPGVPKALEAICLKALAKKPGDRYGTAREMADEARRWLADEPVGAYRDPLTTRLTRWGRRHRTVTVSVAVLLFCTIVGLAVGAILINQERARVETERARAEANFRQARDAVDRYYTTVSESRLLGVPGLQPLRKELLQAAEEYYRDFLIEHGDDPAVQADAADAFFRIGWITQAIGRPADAVEPLQKATSLYQKLADDYPQRPDYRSEEASGHSALGLVALALHKIDEALREQREALAIRAALAKDNPGDVGAQAKLAITHRNLGDIYLQVGKTKEALAEWDKALALRTALLKAPASSDRRKTDWAGRRGWFLPIREDLVSLQMARARVLRETGHPQEALTVLRQARDVLDELQEEHSSDLRFLRLRGDLHNEEGTSYLDLGKLDEAERTYREAIRIFEGLIAGNPKVTAYRLSLADVELYHGWALRLTGQFAAADTAYRKTIELAEGMLADDPSSEDQSLLVAGLTQRGNLLFEEGRADDALPLLRRALEVNEINARKHPEMVYHQLNLSNALRGVGRAEAAIGHAAEALAAYERTRKIEAAFAATYPGSRYNLVCTLALMVRVVPPERRETIALEAIAELQKTLAAGYSNVTNIATDRDLDALRDRKDFQQLMKKLKEK